MIILPAIDLLDRKAVRLLKGDYNQVTVYSNSPLEVAEKFKSLGADYIHMVDLDGAKYGTTPNMDIVAEVAEKTGLFVEIGGGIRSMQTVKDYIGAGVSRVILGTAAICDESFLDEAVAAYGEKIAVGADVKNGNIAVKGWL
ncbi:MAG: HisA/HisF-related TIM barrel protein, partial [Acutalibacteraceae bacterium]|nr:HisA/HisF-related TIM barrel protein [Acutalibacteraceae bacterium]